MKEYETARCPKCGTAIRLTPKQADFDEVIVTCPGCREQFTHKREEQ